MSGVRHSIDIQLHSKRHSTAAQCWSAEDGTPLSSRSFLPSAQPEWRNRAPEHVRYDDSLASKVGNTPAGPVSSDAMRKGSLIVIVSLGVGIVAAAAWFIPLALSPSTRADPNDAELVANGARIYALSCARCHGAGLEGELDWMRRKPNGRLPAPPHDASGHTWHHPDDQLFGIVKNGLQPYAPAGYESDMPAFGGTLSDDEIWAVLAFIKSSWPEEIQERQRAITLQ